MKITKRQLKRIIKEEKAKLLEEALEQVDYDNPNQSWGANDQENREQFQGSMMDLDDHNRIVAQIDRIIINFTKMGYTRADVKEAIKGILEEIG